VKPTVVERSGKAAIATRIPEGVDLGLSVQALQEFSVEATRASRPAPLPHHGAVELTTSWRRYPVLETTLGLLDRALASGARWQLSLWDAAIVEAARELGCRELLSEDFSPRQDFGGVRAVDPFA